MMFMEDQLPKYILYFMFKGGETHICTFHPLILCFQPLQYWIIRMLFQTLLFLPDMSSYFCKKTIKYHFSPPKMDNTAIWRNCNFRLNSIHNVAASTSGIMSQPVFCAFCIFRRLIPFTGRLMMWGIINQTINQYSTKHICGQSSVKRSSVAPA